MYIGYTGTLKTKCTYTGITISTLLGVREGGSGVGWGGGYNCSLNSALIEEWSTWMGFEDGRPCPIRYK